MVCLQDVIGKEVKVLLALKEQYQAIAGKPWQPGAAPAVASSAPSVCAGDQAQELLTKIDAQGVNVRQLKSSGASKVCPLLSHLSLLTRMSLLLRASSSFRLASFLLLHVWPLSCKVASRY